MDWADEIAKILFSNAWDVEPDEVAAALRKAKADGYRLGAHQYFIPISVFDMKTGDASIASNADKIERGE